MNICYFSGIKLPSRSPLSVHVMKMAQAFKKAGHSVSVFAKSVWDAQASDIFKIYDIDVPFDIELGTHKSFPVLLQRRMRLLESQGKKYTGKPDLLYGHDVLALALHASLAHNIIFEAVRVPTAPARKIAFSKLLRSNQLRGLVTNSDILKKELIQRYPMLQSKDIFVAHDGADLVNSIKTDIRNAPALKGQHRFNVGYAGSLTSGKGVDMIARIARIRPEYGFHIIGGKSSRVLAMTHNNKCRNVYFYGHRDHAEIPSFLKAFDVCIAPYQHKALIKTAQNTARWISPMKVFEYMAACKPMICSDLPGINNILRHEHDALLLPPFDEKKWALGLDLMRNDPDYAEQLGYSAHRTLSGKYTWDKRMQAIMAFSKLDGTSTPLSQSA